jgi:AraC family transcriptional regulator, arabinose operon regulatory protein
MILGSSGALGSITHSRMARESATETSLASRREVVLPTEAMETARRERPLLRGLLAVAAGFSPRQTARPNRTPPSGGQVALIYCVKGRGWCEAAGHLHTVRPGDLLILPPGAPHSFGPQPFAPWTVHWVRAVGEHVAEYLRELGVGPQTSMLRVGQDPQLIRLFSEIFHSLQRGAAFANLLQASHALAYLIAVLVQKRQAATFEAADTVQKVAGAIIYMSEHVNESLRVSMLARLAGLSPDYFAQLFKVQTGCSPRDYLHLLRIHRACHLLQTTTLGIKQIANQLGYQDPFHFSRTFKGFQGLSPTDYRAQTTNGSE